MWSNVTHCRLMRHTKWNIFHSFINGSTVHWAMASSVSYVFHTDGRTPWASDQPVARPLPTYRATQTE
jgi:hypothetical protein